MRQIRVDKVEVVYERELKRREKCGNAIVSALTFVNVVSSVLEKRENIKPIIEIVKAFEDHVEVSIRLYGNELVNVTVECFDEEDEVSVNIERKTGGRLSMLVFCVICRYLKEKGFKPKHVEVHTVNIYRPERGQEWIE